MTLIIIVIRVHRLKYTADLFFLYYIFVTSIANSIVFMFDIFIKTL